MNDFEIGYVAGIIDGEGYIGIKKTKTGNLDVSMKVTSTDEDIIDKMIAFTGVGTKNGPYEPTETKKKPYWGWHIQKMRDIQFVLTLVRTVMSQRRQERIEEVLNIISLKLERIIACPVCDNKFFPAAHNSRFCSPKCRRSWNYHSGLKEIKPNPRINPFCARCETIEKESGAYCRKCRKEMYHEKKGEHRV